MAVYRSTIVKQAQEWIGAEENSATHKAIIDLYNSHKPLARGYKVKYTDSWCATFVSAVAIACNATSIIPTECGCEEMIKLFKNMDSFVEDDFYKPSAGDVIFYDWDDSGKGDNKGWSDHVGIVEKVSGNNITVIEGNKNNTVERRVFTVNNKYIRGYGVPKYNTKNNTSNAIKVGDTVRIKNGATTYTGLQLASFVYDRDHKVFEVKENRVVVTYRGIIVAAIHKDNLIKV